jgi:hypothetical protein
MKKKIYQKLLDLLKKIKLFQLFLMLEHPSISDPGAILVK